MIDLINVNNYTFFNIENSWDINKHVAEIQQKLNIWLFFSALLKNWKNVRLNIFKMFQCNAYCEDGLFRWYQFKTNPELSFVFHWRIYVAFR